jgi:N-acetylglucosamine-6-sulfatase
MRARVCLLGGLILVACGRGGDGPTGLPTPGTPTPPPVKPNIVFILADDLDAESIAQMPALQGLLAQGGTSFARAYCAAPLCAPARASILTGRLPHNHDVHNNTPPHGGFESFFASGAEASTVATALHAAGYRTGLVGKYLNGYPRTADGGHIPPGWDDWAVHVGAAEYFTYFMNINRSYQLFGTDAKDYITDVMSGLAVDFVNGTAALTPRQPFFLYIATVAPHLPAMAAPRHGAEFRGAAVPRNPAFNEGDIRDKPGWVRRFPPLKPEDEDYIDRLYRKRLQTMLAVDDLLQSVVQALQATGEIDRTYFFFTSDNGFEQGQHRQASGKGLMYEESIRIPLLVRGPGVPAGITRDHFVSHVDFLPTFVELATGSAPISFDGRSFAPLLTSAAPPASWRADMLVESLTPGDEPPPFYTLRTAQWAYTEYDGGEREMYDLANDPFQLQNLGATVSDATVAPLSQRLATLRRCSGNCW